MVRQLILLVEGPMVWLIEGRLRIRSVGVGRLLMKGHGEASGEPRTAIWVR